MVSERAQAFLQGRAKKLALAAIPLAIAAAGVMPARAGGSVALSTNPATQSTSFTSTGGGNTGAFGSGGGHASGPFNGFNEAILFGNVGTNIVSGSGTNTLIWKYSNTATGTPGVSQIPIAWVFDITSANLSVSVTWELDVDFNSGAVANVFTSPSPLTGRSIYAVNSANYPTQPTLLNLPATLSDYSVEITAKFQESPGTNGLNEISVPNNSSVDLNSSQNPSAPEPAPTLLVAAGLGLLLRIRARASSLSHRPS